MGDSDTTFRELRDEVERFRDNRDWEQYHSPKNLSMCISVEASELMEHFLWDDNQEARDKVKEEKGKENSDSDNEQKVQEVRDELADILIASFLMADSINADITDIIQHKLEKSKKKYPADKVRGKAKKYTEYEEE